MYSAINYQINKKRLSEINKKSYCKNRVKRLAKCKEYYAKNSNLIKNKTKNWKKNNKQKIKEVFGEIPESLRKKGESREFINLLFKCCKSENVIGIFISENDEFEKYIQKYTVEKIDSILDISVVLFTNNAINELI